MRNFWQVLVVCILVGTTPVAGQWWRSMLTYGATATLWVDYCNSSVENRYVGPGSVFGLKLTPPVLTAVNGTEMLINAFAPKKVRPWINIATIVFHIPYLIAQSRRPIGVLQYPRGEQIMYVGWRVWPW